MSGVAALPNTDVPLPRLKIGVFRPHFENADTEIVQRCREVLDTLARHHGAEIVDITIPFLNIMTKVNFKPKCEGVPKLIREPAGSRWNYIVRNPAVR